MGLFATWRHIKRLTDVEDRLREVEARVKALDIEWSDTHDQLQRMLGKIAKRAKQLEKVELPLAPDPGLDQAAEAGGNVTTAPFGSKTAQIMKQIAARRGGG